MDLDNEEEEESRPEVGCEMRSESIVRSSIDGRDLVGERCRRKLLVEGEEDQKDVSFSVEIWPKGGGWNGGEDEEKLFWRDLEKEEAVLKALGRRSPDNRHEPRIIGGGVSTEKKEKEGEGETTARQGERNVLCCHGGGRRGMRRKGGCPSRPPSLFRLLKE